MQAFFAMKHRRWAWVKRVAWITCFIGLVIATRTLFFNSGLHQDWMPDMSVKQDLSSLLVLAGIYMVLLSIPFLPGVELGLFLMCVVGSKMVMIIYLFTVLGLTLSFAMGRWLPMQGIGFFLRKLDSSSFESQGASSQNLINRQAEKLLGVKLMAYLGKNPYLVTGLLLNLPGNFILGGGGGIAMLSGLNRRMSLKCFVVTTALATLPLPLLVFLGYVELERFL